MEKRSFEYIIISCLAQKNNDLESQARDQFERLERRNDRSEARLLASEKRYDSLKQKYDRLKKEKESVEDELKTNKQKLQCKDDENQDKKKTIKLMIWALLVPIFLFVLSKAYQ